MAYRKYTTQEFERLKSQHNIMAVVGNGFDIQVMNDFHQPGDTRYESFYHYLRFRNFDSQNLLVSQMEDLRARGERNWSDLESAISNLLGASGCANQIYDDLRDIQREFSEFLNQTASTQLASQLGLRAMSDKLGIRSLSKFLGDLSASEYKRLKFPSSTDHYDLFNFVFVNLNYTALLDGYIFLDQEQFDPHPHRWADRNFQFFPNPCSYEGGWGNCDTSWSSYLVSDVVHPHGYQDIPRSLLFGIDGADGATHPHKRLSKTYWAQNNIRYGHLFEDTQLFIVFGSSLGETDGWWWRSIGKALREHDAELLLYWWSPSTDELETIDAIREEFLEASGEDDEIADRIAVVLFSRESDRVWLNTLPAGSTTDAIQ